MEKPRGIKITNIDKQKQCDIHVVSSSALKPISMELSKEIRECIDMQTHTEIQMRRCMGIPIKKKKRAWWNFWH